jgi:hypothetical protein
MGSGRQAGMHAGSEGGAGKSSLPMEAVVENFASKDKK